MVQDKAYETGIPQKLGEHANTARDAAAQKYSDLTTEVTALTGLMLEMLADLSPLRTFTYYLEAGLGWGCKQKCYKAPLCPRHTLEMPSMKSVGDGWL